MARLGYSRAQQIGQLMNRSPNVLMSDKSTACSNCCCRNPKPYVRCPLFLYKCHSVAKVCRHRLQVAGIAVAAMAAGACFITATPKAMRTNPYALDTTFRRRGYKFTIARVAWTPLQHSPDGPKTQTARLQFPQWSRQRIIRKPPRT